MKILLTPQLLAFLIGCGYRFCLSKTCSPQNAGDKVTITLKPVRTRPELRNLPADYDTYFNIVLEPVKMAAGIDDLIVMVKLDSTTMLAYLKSVLLPVLNQKQSYG